MGRFKQRRWVDEMMQDWRLRKPVWCENCLKKTCDVYSDAPCDECIEGDDFTIAWEDNCEGCDAPRDWLKSSCRDLCGVCREKRAH